MKNTFLRAVKKRKKLVCSVKGCFFYRRRRCVQVTANELFHKPRGCNRRPNTTKCKGYADRVKLAEKFIKDGPAPPIFGVRLIVTKARKS